MKSARQSEEASMSWTEPEHSSFLRFKTLRSDSLLNWKILVSLSAALRSMPIFIVEFPQKIRIPPHPHMQERNFPQAALKTTPSSIHTHKCTHDEENLLVTRQCPDRIRTPVQAAPTYPIDGHCPPSGAPLRPPTTVARAPGKLWVAAWIRRCGR